MAFSAREHYNSLKKPVFLLAVVLVTRIEGVLSQQGWEIDIALFEDGEGQHTQTTERAKEEYFKELLRSVSRRLELLHLGHFYISRKGFHTLSKSESQALFLRSGNQLSMNEVFNNWMTLRKSLFAKYLHGKAIGVLLTRRSLAFTNGLPASGFAVKGSMCTAHNIAVVQDDGSFLAANKLAKVLVHAIGVDVDGEGVAITCREDSGFLMGNGPYNLPLSFSPCTKSLLRSSVQRMACLKKASAKGSRTIPPPPKISRQMYCSAQGSTHCDIVGMKGVMHHHPVQRECIVYCCKSGLHSERYVAPDGLECGNDVTKLIDRRCVNGKCEQMT